MAASSAGASEHLRAIIDMGSNGIRFSITDLSPPTTRVMPTLYQDRVGISLYDAQWWTGEKVPIPDSVTKDVVRSLVRFKSICHGFHVLDSNVRIIATEATRQAINSEIYRHEIETATGWKVEMLPKEEEGRVGAMGVVSSFGSVEGLMMDLGGGSTQITWVIKTGGKVEMSPKGSVSLPYGAAALSRRLKEAQKGGEPKVNELREDIRNALKDAVEAIQVPLQIRKSAKGMRLYLSGGGFRGWGFILMSQHPIQPYPIPIINGFKATMANFYNTELVTNVVSTNKNLFRVSERRASQVPAVALLVNCLLEALPTISTVYFAQGGIREGSLFSSLPEGIKWQHPLVAALLPYNTPSTTSIQLHFCSAIPVSDLLNSGPGGSDPSLFPSSITHDLLTAFAQAMYMHNSQVKDVQAASALRSTTTGRLASVHGVDHEERAILALMLCERWGGVGALAPADEDFYQRLMALVGNLGWWCSYMGRIGALLGEVYPAGVVSNSKVNLDVRWVEGKVDVGVDFGKDEEGMVQSIGVKKALKQIEKLGKKKHLQGSGHKILLRVESAAAAYSEGSDDDPISAQHDRRNIP